MFIVWHRWCHAQDLPITTTHLGCLSRLTCQSGCQIFSFISGHVSQTSQQKNTWEEGSAWLQLLLGVDSSVTRLWLAGSGCGAPQAKPQKCSTAKLPVYYFSFLLMPCASVLTVNSHLKQPCATELSAGNVSEPHRPFKILPWLKGHQSARRDPYLWVRSPREIHSITFLFFGVWFFFFFFYSSVTMQKSFKAKKIRQMTGRTLTVFLGEGSSLSPPPSPKCWWPAPSLLMAFEAAGPSSRVTILLNVNFQSS